MSLSQQRDQVLLSELGENSYTHLRLQHASPEHLHLTTRRCFIGPIPEGWLKSHRKQWYRHYLARDYSSRAATFRAPNTVNLHRQVTGLDGPSTSVTFSKAFPQPADANDQEENDEEDTADEDGGPDDTGDGKSLDPSEAGKGRSKQYLKPKHNRNLKPGLGRGTPSEAGRSIKTTKAASFVTAPQKRGATPANAAGSPPAASFYTAQTSAQPSRRNREANPAPPEEVLSSETNEDQSRPSNTDSSGRRDPEVTNSKTALLEEHNANEGAKPDAEHSKSAVHNRDRLNTPGLVRFDTADKSAPLGDETLAKVDKGSRARTFRRLRKGERHPGTIVKAEKMLVRADFTVQEIPPNYDENASIKIESRAIEKWREFVVVCRESTSGEEDFVLQLYKTRVIPARAETHVQGKSTHEISLSRKTGLNLYSSLDKTLVLWIPWKNGNLIFILRARSGASAVEWYTFLRQSLGWKRSTQLQIHVPDLSVALQLKNPFGELENVIEEAQKAKSDQAVLRTMQAEKAVASSIIQQAIKALEDNPEWSQVLETWLEREKIGLAWRRYDRLEWVHGANEQKMYGTLAMQRTHDLEIRPKDHYPTGVKAKQGSLTEPAPVEGFLIRLTSQKGNVRRLGRMYYKRLYFTTHNQYLCYCRPARALPPPPPRMPERGDSKIPSASEIVDNSPLIYSVNPFPAHDGEIHWLKTNASMRSQHDEEAYKESERKTKTLLHAEGYINLLHVQRVQTAQRGSSVADTTVDTGPEVDFHEDDPAEETPHNDGKVDSFDDVRTFELVMKNKLVIRLQAYDEHTKNEWIHRLRALVRYWKLRLNDDMQLLKSVREANLQRLGIDEEIEADVGQFASKWEVIRSVASPKIFHMCGISCCRAITMAGTLYHKPKRRSTFLRSGVIVCHGKLLIFHGTLRKRTGEEVPHIQHNRHSVINLSNCYVYSGLLTEGDLLYQNRTFDANHPGHHALPRVFLQDGWTTMDEDSMTCFVVWQPRNKSWFRANEEEVSGSGRARQRLRHVSRLGVPGRSIVFKARSRAERDHWVMSIALEVERMQGGEDIRVVD